MSPSIRPSLGSGQVAIGKNFDADALRNIGRKNSRKAAEARRKQGHKMISQNRGGAKKGIENNHEAQRHEEKK